MAFVQKIQVRMDREAGIYIYGNSSRHSQLLRVYVSDLHQAKKDHLRAPAKDLDFLAVLRPQLRNCCRTQNQYINNKHLLIQKALTTKCSALKALNVPIKI